MAQETYTLLENIINLDVEKLCLDPRLSSFKFENCIENFNKAQLQAKKFKEFEVDSSELFLVENVARFFKEIFEITKEIKNFDPTSQFQNPEYHKEQISTKLQNNFKSYRTTIAQALSFAELTYKLKKADEILAKFGNAKDTTEIKSNLSKYSSELKSELVGEHDKIKNEISNLKAAQASKNLSTHFSEYAKKIGEEIEGEKKDSGWSKFQSIIFPIGIKGKIRVLRIFNYAIPIIFVAGVILFREILEKQTLIELAIFFSVTMSLLFSHLKSATRDLNIQKNSKESYEHRAKVAETFIAFLASEEKDETTKSEMAKQAAIAMFQRVPSGYLTKDQIEPISHPLTEILLKQKITN
jgi:hypothetical protein